MKSRRLKLVKRIVMRPVASLGLPPQDLPCSLSDGADVLTRAQCALHKHERTSCLHDLTLDGNEVAKPNGGKELYVEADRRLFMIALSIRGSEPERGVEQRR